MPTTIDLSIPAPVRGDAEVLGVAIDYVCTTWELFQAAPHATIAAFKIARAQGVSGTQAAPEGPKTITLTAPKDMAAEFTVIEPILRWIYGVGKALQQQPQYR